MIFLSSLECSFVKMESFMKKARYVKITPEDIWRYVAPRAETGDSQVIVMDYAHNHIYAMYPNPVTKQPGFQRPAIKIDLNPHFNEKW